MRGIQGSDIFLKEDVRSVLEGILLANDLLARHLPDQDVQTYRAGFAAAVVAVATAFDITLNLRQVQGYDDFTAARQRLGWRQP